MAFPRNTFLPMEDDGISLDMFDRELFAQLGEQDPQPVVLTRGGLVDRFMEESVSPESPVLGQYSSSPETSFQSSPLLRYFRPSRPRIASTPGLSEYQYAPASTNERSEDSSPSRKMSSSSPSLPRQISFSHAPPVVQGIRLIETKQLPDRFRALFPYPLLNAVQSKCFPHVYENDYNVVVSAPTGSGKTVIMELAVCRLVNNLKDGLFKLVYQAPTRALCSERFRDWSKKFASLGLQCAELTGDTDYAQSRLVQTASIIITTPEKWDSMTRRWRDHSKLMQLVKLFLIDEVHVLNETRGAALEAVVSRMKSVGSNVRFIALSATIPNSEDIATWLGKNDMLQHLPAHKEHFGEDFRPTKLQKFVYGYPCTGNDFAFDRLLGSKLPEIISKHSNRKPMMIFCCTRNSAISTAKELAKLWSNTIPQRRLWAGPVRMPAVKNTDLKAFVASGVAFHHAGLDSDDRHAVEKAFLEGKISIICCTSTLAVGVNLPCYLVIIKNTVCWQEGGCKEYTDLEMMQMLGRAGRPQFDDTAVAVILTKKERVSIYEQMISGTMQLESCLHLNLIDHLNAEISLGTVSDIQSAVKWLAGTFLFVRLRRNPTRYKLKENADRRDEDEMLQQICEKNVKLLQDAELVVRGGAFKSTPWGEAMARYYIKFETMKIILGLPPRTKTSEILSAIAQAEEFHELRLKAAERPFYRELNRAHGIRFPIKVDMAQNAHKISLLIQSELGAVDFPAAEQFQRHKLQFQQDKAIVFNHINRLIRCIIDCQIHKEDGVAVRNCLELARSFAGRVWENSPLQMKQIEQIGVVAVRKLAGAGITSIQELEETEAHKIDMILSKNPPFGMKLLARLAEFPKLRVTIKMLGKASKHGRALRINFKAEIGFLNEKTPTTFHKRPVYVCFVAEISDGRLVDFRRLSAQKLQNDHEILLSAEIKSPLQYITCYVMCDEIGGTCQYAELKPDVSDSFFSGDTLDKSSDRFAMNTSRRRNGTGGTPRQTKPARNESFEDDDIPDDAFLAAVDNVDSYQSQQRSSVNTASRQSRKRERGLNEHHEDIDKVQPIMLENGKYNCNHKCKDKSTCKHVCCREGLDKPPKRTKSNQMNILSSFETVDYLDLTQPSKSEQPTKQITIDRRLVDSKATRMVNLDFASSQATIPKATICKTVGNRKRSNTRRRHSSSEYDNSSVDEYFSPTMPASNSMDNSDSPTVTTALGLDDNFERIMDASNGGLSEDNIQSDVQSPAAKRQRSALPTHESKSVSFDEEKSPTRLSNKKNLKSGPDGVLVKRKIEPLSDATNVGINAPKRPKADTTQPSAESIKNAASHDDPYSIEELRSQEMDQPESRDENIDEMLLQEFGDIVNFSAM
ncbi:DEAD/DEAH box DNA helicase (Mer3), putative [Talaromyces stipitatus ATCC 10500]|uniref:DNA 3'-5' helicase n=1 Tax=Talaromyces stipitatus (strain ATCC 10500 / CBS 375.48 / QM 6759 / NRRL 1006) TaxID=441959 RepID=B8MAK5_TALSN|nr:DEAD/DEAH box DNA helicase (Mer3), putative [Talaromyces stipitatus ATCC 10500]EED17429.1 DEAD/DEAH box DNA helicase (Mer3), putative [Talaromyces stipitatus ATCC 10500]